MKRTVIAICSLLLAPAICIAGFFILTDTCGTLTKELGGVLELIDSGDREALVKKTQEVKAVWEKEHDKIKALTTHSEIDELEGIINSLPVLAAQDNLPRLAEKAETAIGRVEHIIKNETPLLSNIF